MADHADLKKLAESLNRAIEQAEHKPGQWAETARSMGGICCAGEPFQIGKPWAKEEPWAHFSYKRDSWLAVAAVNALPQLMALIVENERLKTLRSKTERDLAQELEVWRHGPSCWNCGDSGDVHDIVGEWRGKCDCFAAQLIDATQERDQLRAEVAGLRTGYEAYEQVNTELKAENERLERNRDMWKGQVERQAEELTALREEVTEWKDTVKFNEGCWSEERGTMIDKLQESRMRIKELDLLFGRYILAMRAAVIEEEHGLGAEGAMMWIYNSLVGPGELPPENETLAQAYFDREIVAVDNGMQEVMAFHEGRRAALGQGEQP